VIPSRHLSASIKRIDLEALFWIAGLIYLAGIKPGAKQHLNFCMVKRMGIKHCPGCGLGRSISFLLHGDLPNSFKAHPLGIFATFIIVARITNLIVYALRKA